MVLLGHRHCLRGHCRRHRHARSCHPARFRGPGGTRAIARTPHGLVGGRRAAARRYRPRRKLAAARGHPRRLCPLDRLFHARSVFRVPCGYYEPLRLACNRELLLGLYEYEGHVTVYPPGRFYRRHVDQFRGAQHRKLSVILYLNDDWAKDDGGELRMYLPDGEGERVLDVLPEAGTLVAFLSHEIPHEVLPAKRERLSLTGWFRTRDGLLP